ncbi:MAG: hypothetical protein WBF07_16185 [Xanthobacteraceae bacterium]
MSDYRNYDYGNPTDPLRGDPQLDPNARPPNAAWGWIAAAIFLVVVLAVAFGYGHKPGQLGTNTASNDVAPPAVSHMAPPATVPPPGAGLAPSTPAPPVPATPANPAPAQPNAAH